MSDIAYPLGRPAGAFPMHFLLLASRLQG